MVIADILQIKFVIIHTYIYINRAIRLKLMSQHQYQPVLSDPTD